MRSSKSKLTPLGKMVVKALTDRDMTKTQLAREIVTQVELARTIGTSQVYLNRILHGDRSGEKYLPAIIAALDLDPRKVEKATAA